MRTEVPDVLTPLTLEQAIEAFAEGHRRCMGEHPTAATLAAIVGHSALETGHWKSMHCWSFGNEKAGASWDGLFTNYQCDETFDAPTAEQARRLGPCVLTPRKDGRVHVVLLKGHPWADFKAAASASDGALRQLVLLATVPRYTTAWHYCCIGDAYGFARGLCSAGYATTPDPEGYSRATQSIAKKILPACVDHVAGLAHSVTNEMREFVEALVFETLRDTRDTDPCDALTAHIEETEGYPV